MMELSREVNVQGESWSEEGEDLMLMNLLMWNMRGLRDCKELTGVEDSYMSATSIICCYLGLRKEK